MKQPAMLLYVGDLKKDPGLRKCSIATRGFWWDALMAMHEDDRCGQISGTAIELGRLIGCTPEEAIECINELRKTGTAEVSFENTDPLIHSPIVTQRNTKVTLVNRRMKAEYLTRNFTKERVKRLRTKNVTPKERSCNTDVTGDLSSSSSFSKDLVANATQPRTSGKTKKTKSEPPLPYTIAKLLGTLYESSRGRVAIDPFDPRHATSLTKVIRTLDDQGITLSDVRMAGEYIAGWDSKYVVDVSWVATTGKLAGVIAKSRMAQKNGNGNGHSAHVAALYAGPPPEEMPLPLGAGFRPGDALGDHEKP